MLKVLAACARRAEAHPAGDGFHRVLASLEQVLGAADAGAEQPFERRSAGLLTETAIQRAHAQARSTGQLTELERRAVRYLHVNCGVSCHNEGARAEAWWTGFRLRLDVDELTSPQTTDAYRTGVRKESYISSPREPGVLLNLVEPGRPKDSAQ